MHRRSSFAFISSLLIAGPAVASSLPQIPQALAGKWTGSCEKQIGSIETEKLELEINEVQSDQFKIVSGSEEFAGSYKFGDNTFQVTGSLAISRSFHWLDDRSFVQKVAIDETTSPSAPYSISPSTGSRAYNSRFDISRVDDGILKIARQPVLKVDFVGKMQREYDLTICELIK